MLQVLIDHNEDLRKLQAKGFVMEVCDGWLIIHHIPYLDADKKIKEGKLFVQLTLSGNKLLKPCNHTAYWSGTWPCDVNGCQLPSLVNKHENKDIVADYQSDYFFSCHADSKVYPPNGDYPNYYEKVTTYFDIIMGPAIQVDPNILQKVNLPLFIHDNNSPLNFMDTNSSRANISQLNDKYKSLKIAIIGLGGSGSYMLDLIAKTPVAEIHIFDADTFNTHNAFRAPGVPTEQQLSESSLKVNYFGDIYDRMHNGINRHPVMIDSMNLSLLDNMDFVFFSLDKVAVKKQIADYLLDRNIPLIDSGMGVNQLQDGTLSGLLHITIGTPQKYDHLNYAFGSEEADDDMYASNIQIAELNSLAACLSVIKWKKMLGFYADTEHEYLSVYNIDDNDISNESQKV